MLLRHGIFLLSTVGLLSCAGLSTDLPEIADLNLTQERRSQVNTALQNRHEYLQRLATIAKPILTENAEICPRLRPYYGLTTHSAKSYSKHINEDASQIFDLTDDPRVLHVIADSPASTAGFQSGDIILDENEKPLTASALRKQDVPDNGQKIVNVKRGEDILQLTVETIPACDYNLRLSSSDTVNAYATGRSIIITTGMMDFTTRDEELAAIIGHELAHNTLAHIRKITTNLIVTGFATRYTRGFESEADYVGLYYAARAGYDMQNVEDIWRRLGTRHPRNIGRAKTHPTTPDRFLRLKAAYDEIQSKRAAGQPLLPNFTSSTTTKPSASKS